MIIWAFFFTLPVAGVLGSLWLVSYMINRENKVWLNGLATGSIVCCVTLYWLFNMPLATLVNDLALTNQPAFQRLHRLGLQAGGNDLVYFWNVLVLLVWFSIPSGVLGALVTWGSRKLTSDS
jgi:hypothetical protein